VIGHTAYVGEVLSSAISGLGIFDINNPAKPTDLGAPVTFIGRATDVTGMPKVPPSGRPIVAISAGTAVDNAIPSNVWLYDVTSPNKPVRVGAVSVSPSANQAGIAIRLAMKDKYLYSSTFLQGLQVIDLVQALTEYDQAVNCDPSQFGCNPTQFGQAVTTEGQGFASDTIVNTIQLPVANSANATMFGLQADDFVLTGNGSGSGPATQALLVATGQLPFVLVDPTQGGPTAVLYPPRVSGTLSQQPLQMTTSDGTTQYQLCLGRDVAINTFPAIVNGVAITKHIAVVVGSGLVGSPGGNISCNTQPPPPLVPLLSVVDVSKPYAPGTPYTPLTIGFLQLSTVPTDVILSGSVALLATGSTVQLVNLADPYHPTSAGIILGNFGNWLTLTSNNILVGSSSVSTTNRLDTAPLVSVAYVSSYSPNPIPSAIPTPQPSNQNLRTLTRDVAISHVISPADPTITSDRVDIIDDLGNTVVSFPGTLNGSQGTVIWPKGFVLDSARKYSTRVYATKDGVQLQTFPTVLATGDSLQTTCVDSRRPGEGALPGQNNYDSQIADAFQSYPDSGFTFEQYKSLIIQESRFNPNAVSPTGARGLLQFTVTAVNDVNQNDPNFAFTTQDAFNPDEAIPAGLIELTANQRRLTAFFQSNNINVTGQTLTALEMSVYNGGIGTIESAFRDCQITCTGLDDLVQIPPGPGKDITDTGLYQAIRENAAALGIDGTSDAQIRAKFNEINNYSRQILATATTCDGGN